ATSVIYTHSLLDALPIYAVDQLAHAGAGARLGDHLVEAAERLLLLGEPEAGEVGVGERGGVERQEARADHLVARRVIAGVAAVRSEEHTSELQSRENLVC